MLFLLKVFCGIQDPKKLSTEVISEDREFRFLNLVCSIAILTKFDFQLSKVQFEGKTSIGILR